MSRRYIAHYQPQAWVNDYAIDVDDEGPDTWDCTEHILGLVRDPKFAAYFRELLEGGDSFYEFLDRDDVLFCDPKMPEWCREYGGPCTITVTTKDD